MEKMEVIISGRGNCLCKGPEAGQAMTGQGSRKEAGVAGKVRWAWGWGVRRAGVVGKARAGAALQALQGVFSSHSESSRSQ